MHTATAQHFGSWIQDYDVKIHAIDIDEEALNSAWRGEYSGNRLRRLRPEWRENTFMGKKRSASAETAAEMAAKAPSRPCQNRDP